MPHQMAYHPAHTQSVLTAIFPGEPGLAGCPLNSLSSFIPGLRILLGQTKTFHVILNTIPMPCCLLLLF